MDTFNHYLQEMHQQDCPMVLDDDLPDSFDDWMVDLEQEDLIKYAEDWGKLKFIEGFNNK